MPKIKTGVALLEAINRALENDPQTEEKARVRAMRDKQRRLVEGEW
ncbi:MAG: hypothetical protein WAM82_11805 [Thermoanaerobaculia bacterium]